MRKYSLLLLFILHNIGFLQAQIPTCTDLAESGPGQRRDLSYPLSRLVINPYDFQQRPDSVSPVIYSNKNTLPLNVGYLNTINNRQDEKRFGRSYPSLLIVLHRNGTLTEAADSYGTKWSPSHLPFEATFTNGNRLCGYDCFINEDVILRHLELNNNESYFIGGKLYGKPELKGNILQVTTANSRYAITFEGLNTASLAWYKTEEDMLKGRTCGWKDANWWNAEVRNRKDLTIYTSFSLLQEPESILKRQLKEALKQGLAQEVLIKQEVYWNDFLKNRIPHPHTFGLSDVPAKNISEDDIRSDYYKAWVFIMQNSLKPEKGVFDYCQMVTGKASLWDEGAPEAPFSAAWEAFVAMQLYAYIDCSASWSALKGLLSLVDEKGMLGGESLPSRKAHTAWLLYELSKDKESLKEVYPSIARYLDWRLENPRWIYNGMTPENEKDAEFVVSAIKDLEYMAQIAEVLGKSTDAERWKQKHSENFKKYLNWFWATPDQLPVQHCNQFKGRDTHPVQITQGLFLKELEGDYLTSLMGVFYKYYNPDNSFAGFNAPKYPDVDFTVYGLLEKNKPALARGLIESCIRDIVRAGSVFAETYTSGYNPQPGGVRPSVFGAAMMIDFCLLRNGYLFSMGTPYLIRLFDGKTGISNIQYNGKTYEIKSEGNSPQTSVTETTTGKTSMFKIATDKKIRFTQ